MLMHPATREIELRAPSAWSCGHGVARWATGCECTEGDSIWKEALRRALDNLAARSDQLFEQYAGETLSDPWAARDAYLPVRNGWETVESFWARYGKQQRAPDDVRQAQRTMLLLEAQYYQQYSFTSCGFFFEDLDRIEPRNDIAFARRAISLNWQALGRFAIDLQREFLKDLQAAVSWRTRLSGVDLYYQLPVLHRDQLPPLPPRPLSAEEEEDVA